MRTFRRAPLALRVGAVCVALVALWFGVNWVYQVARKPTELFFPVSGVLYKTPAQTWSQYGVLFRKHSTDLIEPELLAALAQVEGSGNPLVRTYWRWTSSANPFEIFRPASSAVGMYQITDGTFREAKRYCVHDHVVVEDGPWHDWRSCWFNALYSRVIPSHAIEMTSAYLDRRVSAILARPGVPAAGLAQKRQLAAVVHLCGAGAAERFARNGFHFRGERCGQHDPQEYVRKVESLVSYFRGRLRES